MQLMISAKASKVELLKAYGDLTLEKVATMKPMSLAQMAKVEEPEVCMKYVAVIVADLSQFFNGDLEREDIEEVAAEVQFSMLKNLTLEDVYVACMRIKRSKVSYKLTANEVLRQLNAYMDERCTYIANLNLSGHFSEQYREESNSEKRAKKEKETKRIAELLDTSKLLK